MKDIPSVHNRTSRRRREYYLESLWPWSPHSVPTDVMNIIKGLDLVTVYSSKLEPVARRPPASVRGWEWISRSPFARGTLLENGLTRFDDLEFPTRLVLEGRHAGLNPTLFTEALMAQLPRIVNGVESTDGVVTLDPPVLRLHGSGKVRYDGVAELFTLDHNAREDIKTIYLFIYPVHMTTISELMAWETSRTHFWSFDETGRSEIPNDECKEIGLPELTASLLSDHDHAPLSPWPATKCNAIRDWQIARGFDPTTADFARHLGYPEFEIVEARNEEDRFEDVDDPNPIEDKSGLSWLWTAFPGSDISACAC
ncbi:hypothetical protein Moror_12606 [Moniliophthora roreri MCA 2997]|nr:hypothetical protein Moror_12606 [Moniliophthora roreri MCA 2997]